jgi:hypothetical protein
MNIFVLDYDIMKCAAYHNDRHCVKMILESAQMLSTACRLSGLDVGYKATHINHPANKWTRNSLYNWLWLRELVINLNSEWKRRFNHHENHKSYEVVMSLPYPKINDIGLTDFAQAMPDQYRNKDTVDAYRNYYIGEKRDIANWKNNIPWWWK